MSTSFLPQVNLKVNHCLLALPGTTKESIKRVMSHPQVSAGTSASSCLVSTWLTGSLQALSQCDGYLTRMGVIKESVDDTAGAAKTIAEKGLRYGPTLCVTIAVPLTRSLSPAQGLRCRGELEGGGAVRPAGAGHVHPG